MVADPSHEALALAARRTVESRALCVVTVQGDRRYLGRRVHETPFLTDPTEDSPGAQ